MALWRGDLSPFGGEAVANPAGRVCLKKLGCMVLGLLRSPTGINPLATGLLSSFEDQ
jgi:hypothetical protein